VDTLGDHVVSGGNEQDTGTSETGQAVPAEGADTSHSDDFTSVNWFGTRYDFSKGLQARCVERLWEAWKKGGHSLSQLTLKEQVGSDNDNFRLDHVFRGHPAFDTMIKRVGKGTFKLAEPGEEI
jgi:hypothetical protein